MNAVYTLTSHDFLSRGRDSATEQRRYTAIQRNILESFGGWPQMWFAFSQSVVKCLNRIIEAYHASTSSHTRKRCWRPFRAIRGHGLGVSGRPLLLRVPLRLRQHQGRKGRSPEVWKINLMRVLSYPKDQGNEVDSWAFQNANLWRMEKHEITMLRHQQQEIWRQGD